MAFSYLIKFESLRQSIVNTLGFDYGFSMLEDYYQCMSGRRVHD